ncbi:MAG: O-antigen ligase family protein [Chloroflexota bacterium]
MVVTLALLAGWAVGAAVALGSPVWMLAAAGGLIAAWLVTRSVQAGLLGVIVVASLLPFAVIPVRVGVSLTFMDALLASIVLGWLVRHVLPAGRLELTLAGKLLLAYLVTAVAALVIGAAYAPPTGAAIRSFLKYVVAIGLFIVVVDVVRDRRTIRQMVRALMIGGMLAAAVGLAIQALPRPQIVDVLSSLSVLGYPSGPGVLRFLPGPNNTYSDTLRAVGTSIDPNVFGGMLMLAATMMLAQLFAARPLLPRWLLLGGLAITAAAMVASESRASWLGLAAAGALLATIRDRRLWLLAIPAAGASLALPLGQRMIARLASGFAAQDRAAALRIDEYRQAIQIISDYPVLGVGFGGAPELGTFVGVSSIYLLVGENTGLIGLGLFLLTLAVVGLGGLRAAVLTSDIEDRALAATLLAPVLAAALVGNLDHYFMNPQFPHMVALFWLYIGLLAAVTRVAGRQPTDS